MQLISLSALLIMLIVIGCHCYVIITKYLMNYSNNIHYNSVIYITSIFVLLIIIIFIIIFIIILILILMIVVYAMIVISNRKENIKLILILRVTNTKGHFYYRYPPRPHRHRSSSLSLHHRRNCLHCVISLTPCLKRRQSHLPLLDLVHWLWCSVRSAANALHK